MTWYRIVTPFAVGGVAVRCGRVMTTPPIFKWMIGKAWASVRLWIHGKGYEYSRLESK